MDVEIYDNDIYINRNPIAYFENDTIVIHLRNDSLLDLKASFIDAINDYDMVLKVCNDYATVRIDTDDIPMNVNIIHVKYKSYVRELIELFDLSFHIEITSKGKVEAVGDCISILIGKQRGEDIIIKLNKLYNRYVKDAVIEFLMEDEAFYTIVEEDRIVLCTSDHYTERLSEMFE